MRKVDISVNNMRKIKRYMQQYENLLNSLKGCTFCNHNNPVGEYAEFICCAALQLEMADNNKAGYDLSDKEQKKYQIKARRFYEKQEVVFELRKNKNGDFGFDYLIAIIFGENFLVDKAYMIEREEIEKIVGEKKEYDLKYRNGGFIDNFELKKDLTKEFQEYLLKL